MDISQLLKDFAEAISPAVQVLFQAILVGLSAQVSAWLYKTYQLKKNELSREQQYLLELVARNAVHAAEQVLVDNADRRAYAFDAVERQLKQYGLVIDIDVIYSAIEAEVGKLPHG